MVSPLRPNDILWTRSGDPTRVEKVDDKSGEVSLDNNFANIQKNARHGVKNGLNTPSKEAFNTTLSAVENPDKKQEIRDLFEKIKSLKGSNTDQRLLKYLNNELQFKMVRENFIPENYGVNPQNLDL